MKKETLLLMKTKRLLFDASLESTLKELASETLQMDFNETRLRPVARDTNGTLVQFRAFCRMKNTWVMHCFKRLSRQTSLRRPESRMMVPHLSAM